MLRVALKMLLGNKTAFFGIVFGVFLATLLIAQQSAIFLGLVSRSYRMVTDIPAPNVWVIDPATESDDKLRELPSGYLDLIKSVPGVEWAAPLSMTHLPVSTKSNRFEISLIFGIDDATLVGAPVQMTEGQSRDLRREGGAIIDMYAAKGALAATKSDGTIIPLKIGDDIEINNHHAVVVGFSKITRGFYPQPIIYTSRSEFINITGSNALAAILVKTAPNAKVQDVLDKINSYPGLNALTKEQFQWRIAESFLKTGILINVLLSVILAIIIGLAISGQIFYRMTLENLMHYALIKSMGGTQKMITQMITVQAIISGVIGFALGIIATLFWGQAIKDTTLAFWFPWELWVFTGSIILGICALTAVLSIRRVFKTDPKVLMGT